MKNKIRKFFVCMTFTITVFGNHSQQIFADEISQGAVMNEVKIMEASNTEIVTPAYIQEQEEIKEQEESELNTIHYIAMGNSVTCNEPCDFWWGTWGMASSSPEKDYVHLVTEYIKNQTGKEVETKTVSIKNWEIPSDGNRNAVLSSYDQYLDEDTDVITLQCGENITTFVETTPTDFNDLILHIKEKAPNAQLIVLPNLLWDFQDVENAKENACNVNNVPIADMGDYFTNYDALYKSSVGTPVLGTDGQVHAIWYDIVGAHPNDAGMERIAQGIISNIDVDGLKAQFN